MEFIGNTCSLNRFSSNRVNITGTETTCRWRELEFGEFFFWSKLKTNINSMLDEQNSADCCKCKQKSGSLKLVCCILSDKIKDLKE